MSKTRRRDIVAANRAAKRQQKEAETIPERIYNQSEAAQYIGVSIPTLRLYFRQGKIKFRQEGRKYFVAEVELDNFLKGKKNND